MNNDECADGTHPNTVLQRQKLDVSIGKYVSFSGTVYKVTQLLDFDTVLGIAAETGRSRILRIQELAPLVTAAPDLQTIAAQDIEDIADADWNIAMERYSAIKPLLNQSGRQAVNERALELDIDPSTLYRWLKRYNSLGIIATLIPKQRGWTKGNSRLSKHTENIIQEVLQDTYLTHQRSSPQKAVLEVLRRCQQRGVDAPHPNTVRSRIAALSEKQRLWSRGFKEKAKNKFLPAAGKFPNANYPLAVVQIDHTPVDLILVDDIYRKPIGKPWITLAIDVYSRMVVGYYLSFDPPSETSVAMCVAHSILPKDEWLALHGVDARWDVWGYMETIHTDNGAEFRSDNFKKSCLMHDIKLEFRPVKQPRYGGHIERMLGTLLREIHDLPGTTFSSIKHREGYNSEQHAAMTKTEFETWLVTLICKVYHQRLHSGIGMSPSKCWEIGMFGNTDIPGRGLPPRPTNRQALLLDFLPSFRRTVQTYGASIDGLNYYADVLRSWINSTDPTDRKKKREFIFRRDPRDISSIWFYDPEAKEYFKIPFANQTLPSMSIWEYQQAREETRKRGQASVNEHQILQAITELRHKVEESKEKTKRARRMSQRRREHEKGISPATPTSAKPALEALKPSPATPFAGLLDTDVDAFDDIA